MNFQNKTVFVTGAGGYIGGEVACTLAAKGAFVAVCDISRKNAQKTADRIREAGGRVIAVAADVTEPASIETALTQVCDSFGDLDISIHVAGGSARIAGKDARYTHLVSQEDYVIDRVLKINLYSAMYVARAAARRMIAQGHGGRIISFSSVVGMNGLQSCVEHAAAKGGVIAMTKALAKELGSHGITVNSVAPGIVMRPEESNAGDRATKTNFPGIQCTAADIAAVTAFLASDEARFVTGQTYVVDGGRSLAMKGTD